MTPNPETLTKELREAARRGHYANRPAILYGEAATYIDTLTTRLREVEEWMLEAKLAIEAATVIAEREGCHLNLGNHDRLVREYAALSTERTPT